MSLLFRTVSGGDTVLPDDEDKEEEVDNEDREDDEEAPVEVSLLFEVESKRIHIIECVVLSAAIYLVMKSYLFVAAFRRVRGREDEENQREV